ncbi:MAG TPA: replication-relaxation family protein [Ktedonobacteraceae bacterium]|nr:replication-relaxation family protein [Ktedonobacteraceae bacterium]
MSEPFFLTPTLERLLIGDKRDEPRIGLYHLYKASASQLGRVRRYSPKSIKRVKALLHTLAEHDYVRWDKQPTADYRSPYYYVLGSRGIEYIKSIGWPISDSYRPYKEIGQNYLQLLHKLGLNDILISAALLKWHAPGCFLASFQLERELAKNPYHTLWHGKPHRLIPDAFLDLRQLLDDGRQRRTPVFIEHNRGTEQEEVIRRKGHAYATMMKTGWFREQFTMNSLAVVFTTFEGARRRDQLRTWIYEEIRHEARSIGESFLFSTQPQPPDAHIWLSPCFYTPFVEDKPVALLGG